ncbi:Hypothetical predicted protein [Pelobates cultripes]|uniref:Integrase zinc-binding domain-containing protein n=1 Tax=Pelobates cultripes TaxID=61616 RepID=A0AAD1WNY7_PELCU|nr:Hypothetical predicted protein [Pelobates cultripes]
MESSVLQSRNQENLGFWIGYMVAYMAVTSFYDSYKRSLGYRFVGADMGDNEKAKISEASVENLNSLLGLATWAHQKCGHLGEKATHRWAQQRGILVPLDLIKTVILQCPVCQHEQNRHVPGMV